MNNQPKTSNREIAVEFYDEKKGVEWLDARGIEYVDNDNGMFTVTVRTQEEYELMNKNNNVSYLSDL